MEKDNQHTTLPLSPTHSPPPPPTLSNSNSTSTSSQVDDESFNSPSNLSKTFSVTPPNLSSPNYSSTDILLEPYTYLLRIPGKDIRGLLISAFNLYLHLPPSILSQIKTIITLLHNSSLLIDDIKDSSLLRRGVPVAHLIYGVPHTINCANYIYFLALHYTQAMGNKNATKIFLEEMLALHHGQGYDIYWRDHMKCPTEQEYKQMVLDKTGGLFRLAIKLMQCFAEEEKEKNGQKNEENLNFEGLVNLMAMYFQIRDDYVNLQSVECRDNKGFCEDLTEGKFSFVIIHGIRRGEEKGDKRLWNILKQRTGSVELKKYAVKLLEEAGSFEYTLKVLKELEQDVVKEMNKFGKNVELERILGLLSKM